MYILYTCFYTHQKAQSIRFFHQPIGQMNRSNRKTANQAIFRQIFFLILCSRLGKWERNHISAITMIVIRYQNERLYLRSVAYRYIECCCWCGLLSRMPLNKHQSVDDTRYILRIHVCVIPMSHACINPLLSLLKWKYSIRCQFDAKRLCYCRGKCSSLLSKFYT